jgi:hypothetical protein
MLDLFPESARVEGGELALGGVATSALAAEFGTPLVVYCERTIRAQARAYRAAAPGALVAYGTKAFANVALLRLLAEEGLGADAFLREQLQQRDVRERLRPVEEERPGRGVAVGTRLRADRLLAIDDEGRSVLGGEAARGDAAEAQLTGVDAGGIGKKRKHRLLVSKSR